MWTFINCYFWSLKLGKAMTANIKHCVKSVQIWSFFWSVFGHFSGSEVLTFECRCSVFLGCLLRYHSRSIYSCTLDSEKAQINVFVKYEFTAKPTFRKNEKCLGYMYCFSKIQILVLQTNKNKTKTSWWYGNEASL